MFVVRHPRVGLLACRCHHRPLRIGFWNVVERRISESCLGGVVVRRQRCLGERASRWRDHQLKSSVHRAARHSPLALGVPRRLLLHLRGDDQEAEEATRSGTVANGSLMRQVRDEAPVVLHSWGRKGRSGFPIHDRLTFRRSLRLNVASKPRSEPSGARYTISSLLAARLDL